MATTRRTTRKGGAATGGRGAGKAARARSAGKRRKGSGAGEAPAGAGGRTGEASGLRVRMYRVGFGDFFLLTVTTAGGPRHVLIDCGVHAGNLGTIDQAIDDLARATDRKLSLVVATHRHADHISGFASSAARFAEFEVGAVWMSWWDDPENARAANFQAALARFAETAAAQLQARLRTAGAADAEPIRQALDMVGNATGLGAAASNDAALALLRGVPRGGPRFKNDPVRRYYKAGDVAELPPDLAAAGVQATLLGPPIDPRLMAQMSNAAQEYLQAADEAEAARRSGPTGRTPGPFAAAWATKDPVGYAPEALAPFDARELARRVDANQPDSLLEAARRADNTLNNQSLVILFTAAGKRLLFVGDAQWGNWENFLYGGAAGTGRVELLPRSQELLQGVDFYKVGHHGSTNATPLAAVQALQRGCAAMCSTEPDCYGSAAKGTEVPRSPLLEALEEQTGGRLVRSDQVKAGEAPPTKGLPTALPPGFTRGAQDQLYIDWTP